MSQNSIVVWRMREQNIHSQVAAMFSTMMQNKPSFLVIDHTFMINGHSHLECDLDHELIEKQIKI